MNFARPELLPLTVMVPLALALALVLYAQRRRRMAAAFSDAHLLERLGGAELLRFPRARLILIAAAGAALALAAAGPRWGMRATEGRALSMNVVIAADISKSMLAQDVEPNRLERARLFSRQLMRQLPGDRFGLVVFAGRAYVLSPLTVDQSAIELYLDALDPNMVSQGGSSLAAAITQATDLARGSGEDGGDRAIVLLTDGEALENRDAVTAAADRAARAGIRIIAVGVGTPAGATVPDIDPATGEVMGPKRDELGSVVVSRLDGELLRIVADRTGGSYVRLDQANALASVMSELRRMQRAEGENTRRLEPRERFAWFALAALLLLVVDAVRYGPAVRLPRRRAGVQAALLLLVLTATAAGIGDVERGNRLYREGRYEEAVEAYQRAIAAGRTSPQVHYNLGTALLALGRYQDAERQFQAALQDVDPELRQRAFYNLGNRFLQEGRTQPDLREQGGLLDASIDAYRRALRIDPEDVDAKWNLELALREREENQQRQQSMPQQQDRDQEQSDQDQQDQQGGGSGGAGPQGEAGEGQDAGTSTQQQPMTQEQADRILSALEQDERQLAREKLSRGQQRTPVLRDW